jgi:hypothetical protein
VHRLRALHQHRPLIPNLAHVTEPRHFRLDFVVRNRDQVIRRKRTAILQPPRSDLSEHGTFVRNRLWHHHIESADAIRGNDEQPIVADIVDVANLAAPDQWERQFSLRNRGTHHDFSSGASSSTS